MPLNGSGKCDASWAPITRLAHWAEPVQNQPRPPFRWVGYDGDAGHGCGNHLHLSWEHAAGADVPARRMGRGLPGGQPERPCAPQPTATGERGPRGGVRSQPSGISAREAMTSPEIIAARMRPSDARDTPPSRRPA